MQGTTPPQPERDTLERFCDQPDLISAAAELLWSAGRTDDQAEWLAVGLSIVLKATGGDYAALAAVEAGRWTTTAEAGAARSLPVELLSEVLDREAVAISGNWVVAPLTPQTATAEVLLVHATEPRNVLIAVEQLAPVVRDSLATVRCRGRDQRRIRRLEAVLDIAGRWNRTHQLEPLLTQMAEAATRLLEADRASIFLWDKPNKLLVGRPALGIEQDELRIPDDRGVVGRVVQTGRPLRIDAATEPEVVDHQVDAQLQYKTKTLLCVPLRGGTGELFGAFEVINKRSGTFTDEDQSALIELAAHAAIALENVQDRQRLLSINRQIAEQAAEGVRLIGNDPAVEALRLTAGRVADTDLAILLLGENGTGKEVVAQLIHYMSRRRDRPFIAVNCAAIPDTLAESELFGHEKGAFTDAVESRHGKFELADGGTLLLDEISELSLGSQAKLLRVLEEKTLVRVGGSASIRTDARVLAASNQNLADMVCRKLFREDLYFRLNVVTLELPPLRKRGADIMLLAEHFLDDFCRRARRRVPKFTAEAKKRLTSHPWPGNVRELRNLMERLAYLSTEDRIEAEELAFILSPRGGTTMPNVPEGSLTDATTRFQEEYIRRAIEQSAGNMSRAAEQLGLHRSNLYRKMHQLGMQEPE